MPTEVRFHGPELAEAQRRVDDLDAMAARHGVCMAGLMARVDFQMAEYARRSAEEVRADLAAEGVSADHLTDDELLYAVMRSLIGGAYTIGLGTGLELVAGAPAPRRYSPIPEGRGGDGD